MELSVRREYESSYLTDHPPAWATIYRGLMGRVHPISAGPSKPYKSDDYFDLGARQMIHNITRVLKAGRFNGVLFITSDF